MQWRPTANLCFVFASISACGSCVLGEDVTGLTTATVTARVPYQTVLLDEPVKIIVRLHNHSKRELPYVVRIDEAACKQLFLEVKRGDTLFAARMASEDPMAVSSPEKDGHWDAVSRTASAVVRPGQGVTWDEGAWWMLSGLFMLTQGRPESFRVQVLIGPKHWISSQPVPIKVIPRRAESYPVVLKGVFYDWGQREYPMTFHRVPIGDAEFLFTSAGGRVCQIPKGRSPRLDWDPYMLHLSVRFDGPGEISVLYDALRLTVLGEQAFVSACRWRLEAKALYPVLKARILNALARNGTPKSIELFDKHGGSDDSLLGHRNSYECVRLLLSRATAMKNAEDARKLVMQCLFAKEHKPAKGPTFALPKIAPMEAEAKKFSELLKGFAKAHGDIPLTKDDVLRIEKLVGEIEQAAKRLPAAP